MRPQKYKKFRDTAAAHLNILHPVVIDEDTNRMYDYYLSFASLIRELD